jgi:hypothetical protein
MRRPRRHTPRLPLSEIGRKTFGESELGRHDRSTLELAAKPDSVPSPRKGGSHLSGARVTAHLDAAYPELRGNGPLPVPKGDLPLLGLAPGGVCLAEAVTRLAGGLLHRHFTLTSHMPRGGVLSVALCRRVTPPGC